MRTYQMQPIGGPSTVLRLRSGCSSGQALRLPAAILIILLLAVGCVPVVLPAQAPPAPPTATPGPDLLGLVKAYEDAYNRQDVDALVSMFADNGSIQTADIGDICVGKTAQPGIPELQGCFVWELVGKPQMHLSECTVQESKVTCQAVLLEDKILALAGMDEVHLPEYVFTFTDGKIQTVRSVMAAEEAARSYAWRDRAGTWANSFRREEFAKVAQYGTQHYFTREAAETWLKLVEEYVASHPLPSPTPAATPEPSPTP